VARHAAALGGEPEHHLVVLSRVALAGWAVGTNTAAAHCRIRIGSLRKQQTNLGDGCAWRCSSNRARFRPRRLAISWIAPSNCTLGYRPGIASVIVAGSLVASHRAGRGRQRDCLLDPRCELTPTIFRGLRMLMLKVSSFIVGSMVADATVDGGVWHHRRATTSHRP
jgi:hypothetical protein